MTRQQAKELLPIITAFAEGKVIQLNRGNEESPLWQTVCTNLNDSLGFVSPISAYRIEPEPREFWLIVDKKSAITYSVWVTNPYNSKTFDQDSYDVIHVREILPE